MMTLYERCVSLAVALVMYADRAPAAAVSEAEKLLDECLDTQGEWLAAVTQVREAISTNNKEA
tara:strand:+ start:41 stop:229 length:189 start_codon:yes stop_codon:yes gene_type:complete